MGEPGGGNAPSPANESIVCEEGTRGTETSQYPEEKKVKTIPSVAASERGGAQTGRLRFSGVADRQEREAIPGEERWKAPPEKVRGLYPKGEGAEPAPEYHRTRGIRWEAGRTTFQG